MPPSLKLVILTSALQHCVTVLCKDVTLKLKSVYYNHQITTTCYLTSALQHCVKMGRHHRVKPSKQFILTCVDIWASTWRFTKTWHLTLHVYSTKPIFHGLSQDWEFTSPKNIIKKGWVCIFFLAQLLTIGLLF